jgi:hypothetical protein
MRSPARWRDACHGRPCAECCAALVVFGTIDRVCQEGAVLHVAPHLTSDQVYMVEVLEAEMSTWKAMLCRSSPSRPISSMSATSSKNLIDRRTKIKTRLLLVRGLEEIAVHSPLLWTMRACV